MRTRETWELIAQEFPEVPGRVIWMEELYHAPAQTMLDALRGAEQATTVLMLGHNPGIGGFATMIVRQPPDHLRFRDYPTAATTIVDFDLAHWRDVDWGMGTVRDFVIPREI